MIKLWACLLMVIDHVGLCIFPERVAFRLVGRLSMPLFSYCVARGFHHSAQREAVGRYLRNLAWFSAVSQVPYHFFSGGLNIGFTWLLSAGLLAVLQSKQRVGVVFAAVLSLLLAAYCLPVSYGVYGVLCPLLFHDTLVEGTWPNAVLPGLAALWGLSLLLHPGQSLLQGASILAVWLIQLLLPVDHQLRLGKRVYYVFYPAHLTVLVLARAAWAG